MAWASSSELIQDMAAPLCQGRALPPSCCPCTILRPVAGHTAGLWPEPGDSGEGSSAELRAVPYAPPPTQGTGLGGTHCRGTF